MQIVRHTITVTFADTKERIGFDVLSQKALDNEGRGRLHKFMEQNFTGITVSFDDPEEDVIVREPTEAIAHELHAIVEERRPELLRGATVDAGDARLNELERTVGMLTRGMDRIVALLERNTMTLVDDKRTQLVVPVSPPPPPPAVPDSFLGVDHLPNPQLAQQQAAAAQKGFPLVGTPSPVSGDATLPTNPNARGSGRTPEMASGMMATSGPSARSQFMTYSGKTDEKGQPVFDNLELPKVGDSLKSAASLSDIKVP